MGQNFFYGRATRKPWDRHEMDLFLESRWSSSLLRLAFVLSFQFYLADFQQEIPARPKSPRML
jgi:hypothetical protein